MGPSSGRGPGRRSLQRPPVRRGFLRLRRHRGADVGCGRY